MPTALPKAGFTSTQSALVPLLLDGIAGDEPNGDPRRRFTHPDRWKRVESANDPSPALKGSLSPSELTLTHIFYRWTPGLALALRGTLDTLRQCRPAAVNHAR